MDLTDDHHRGTELTEYAQSDEPIFPQAARMARWEPGWWHRFSRNDGKRLYVTSTSLDALCGAIG